MKSNGNLRLASSRLYSAILALPKLAAFGVVTSSLALLSSSSFGQTTISSGVNLFSTETTLDLGALTKASGGIALFSGGGTISATGTLTNGVLPWGIVQKSGTAANNSSNGYTFATISGGSIASYTSATAVTTSYPANSATVNYDWSSSGTQAAIGSSRAANTIRYTGTGVTQATNSTQTETFNALMNAGSGTVTLGGGSIMNIQSATGELVLAAMTANIVINGRIVNNGGTPGAVTIVGSNTVTLGGANTATGMLTVTSGATLALATGTTVANSIQGSGNINSASATLTGNASGYTGTLTHNSTTSSTSFNLATATSKNAAYHIASAQGSSQGMIAGLAGDHTLEIGALSGVTDSLFRGGNVATGTTTLKIGNLDTDTVFNGAINNGATKTLALTKVGTGSLTLGGSVNTYAGATSIEAGTLIVNGSLASSAISVSSGAIFSGSGTITNSTTVSGTLSPGNSPGVMTFSGALTLNSGSISLFEINGTTRGTTYDGVDVGGALTLGGTMDLRFNAAISAGTYSLFGGAFAAPTGTFGAVSIGGSFAEALSGAANITGSGWTASSPSWIYSFDNVSGDLNVSAVPETSTWASLAGLVGLGFAGLRRRRRVG